MAEIERKFKKLMTPELKKELATMAKKTAALVKKLMTRRKNFIDAYIKAYLAENPGLKISDCELVEQHDDGMGTFTWYLRKKGAK